jgi:hypothetical protein
MGSTFCSVRSLRYVSCCVYSYLIEPNISDIYRLI